MTSYGRVDPATFYRWLYADATFRDTVEKAEADAEARAVAIVIRAAQNGTWQAATWWLEHRRREDYGPQSKLEVSGPGGGPIESRDVTGGWDPDQAFAAQVLSAPFVRARTSFPLFYHAHGRPRAPEWRDE